MPRIIAWNILHGGGTRRTPHIALALAELAPDAVVLSEFRDTLGGQILGALADRGLTHVAHAMRPPGCGPANRVAVASRWPLLEVTEPIPAPPACLGNRLVCRRLGEAGPILTGVHLHDDSRPADAIAGWAWLAAHGVALRDSAHIIIGDLNGSRDRASRVIRRAERHRPPPPHVLHALGRLSTAGYADAFDGRSDGPEGTWKSHAGRELRLDHALVSGTLAPSLLGARYAHQPRKEAVSDHSLLVVELASWDVPESPTEQKIAKTHEKTPLQPICRPCQTAGGAIERRGSRRESKLFME